MIRLRAKRAREKEREEREARERGLRQRERAERGERGKKMMPCNCPQITVHMNSPNSHGGEVGQGVRGEKKS